MRRTFRICAALVFCALLVALAGCKPTARQLAESSSKLTPVKLPKSGKLKVICTTSIIGDIVANVGKDRIDLKVLLPVGMDPHSFDPTPRDIAALSEAHVLFANGAGLEEFLAKMIANARDKVGVVYVSEGISLLEHEEEHGEETKSEKKEHHRHEVDPHTWTSPVNVITFV